MKLLRLVYPRLVLVANDSGGTELLCLAVIDVILVSVPLGRTRSEC